MPLEAAPTAPSLHETLAAAMEQHSTPPAESPAAETPPAEPTIAEARPDAPPQETEAQKAERLRNKDGTFAKGKPEEKKPEVKPEVKAEAPAAPPKPKLPRPSSWKKELEQHWDTLPTEVQQYVGQREKEYATGVSTYKSEADRAKDVMSVIAQFEPHLQQHGVPVKKWIQDLGTAHHTLALGSQQDKVQQVARIIQGYGVDAQALYQLLSGQQPQYKEQPRIATPPAPSITPEQIEKVVEQKLLTKEAVSAWKTFTEAKNADGSLKYQYHEDEEVKGTMAGLLQAGLAQDYPSAYEAALRLPKHEHLKAALQEQQAVTKEAERVAAANATAQRARSQAVSVKSSTPSTMAQPEGKKGLRDEISRAFDGVTSGRV